MTSVSTCFWFDDSALQAARLYVSLFEDGQITNISWRSDDPSRAMSVAFTLAGQSYWGLNGGPMFPHSPAASISVHVDTQAEIDHFWAALTANGGRESRCGWLIDPFGLSWQIIPRALPRLLGADRSGRVMAAMMGMAKLDIAALEAAGQ